MKTKFLLIASIFTIHSLIYQPCFAGTVIPPQVIPEIVSALRLLKLNSAARSLEDLHLLANDLRIPERALLETLGIRADLEISKSILSDEKFVQDIANKLRSHTSFDDYLPRLNAEHVSNEVTSGAIQKYLTKASSDFSVASHQSYNSIVASSQEVAESLKVLSNKNPMATLRLLEQELLSQSSFLKLPKEHPSRLSLDGLVKSLEDLGQGRHAASESLINFYFKNKASPLFSHSQLEISKRYYSAENSLLSRFIEKGAKHLQLNIPLGGTGAASAAGSTEARVITFGQEQLADFLHMFLNENQLAFQVLSTKDKSRMIVSGKVFGGMLDTPSAICSLDDLAVIMPIPLDTEKIAQLSQRLNAVGSEQDVRGLIGNSKLHSQVPWDLMQTSDIWHGTLSFDFKATVKSKLKNQNQVLFVYLPDGAKFSEEALAIKVSEFFEIRMPTSIGKNFRLEELPILSHSHDATVDALETSLTQFSKKESKTALLLDPETPLKTISYRNTIIDQAFTIDNNPLHTTTISLSELNDDLFLIHHSADSKGGPVVMAKMLDRQSGRVQIYVSKNGLGNTEHTFDFNVTEIKHLMTQDGEVIALINSKDNNVRILVVGDANPESGLVGGIEIFDRPIQSNVDFFLLWDKQNTQFLTGLSTGEGSGFMFLPSRISHFELSTGFRSIESTFMTFNQTNDALQILIQDSKALESQIESFIFAINDVPSFQALINHPTLGARLKLFISNYTESRIKLQSSINLPTGLLESAPLPPSEITGLASQLEKIHAWALKAKSNLYE